MVAGKGFHPELVVMGTLSEHLLAQDGNADDLAKEMDHLLRPRQAAEIAVDDNSIEAMVDKEEQLTKELFEQLHGNLTLLKLGERREP